MQRHAIFVDALARAPRITPKSFCLPRRLAQADTLAIGIRFSYDSSALDEALSHAVFSRIAPVCKPCGSRSTCHCHVDLSNRSAVEKMASEVVFATQKQLAQKPVGSRDHCTSCVCSGLVDGMAQGCNIRSPVALA
jgi:hypothetical protein